MNLPKYRNFTLIELLVVVSVIAILAGLLLPVLSKARERGRQANCMSNMKQMGTALLMYADDSAGFYPTAYTYNNATNSDNGYLHWSGLLRRAGVMEIGTKAYVCPSNKVGGWAPTCFGGNLTYQDPVTGQGGLPVTAPGNNGWTQTTLNTSRDDQAPRMSYTPNEVFLPRRKNASVEAFLRLVKSSEPVKPAGEILMAEYCDDQRLIIDTSATGGSAVKSHRPTAGLCAASGAGQYDSESGLQAEVRATTYAKAVAARNAALTAGNSNGMEHINYVAWDLHGGASNYMFADGHSEKVRLEETLNENDFLWGKYVYSQTNKIPVTKNDGTGPVQ